MAQDIDGLLAPFSDGSYPLRVLDAIFKVSPDAPRVRAFTSLGQAAPGFGLSEDATLVESARAIARDQPAQSAVWMLQALDAGDDVMSVLGGVASALKLYIADKTSVTTAETSQARQQQREDAVKKGLGISWAVGRLFGGSPEERVRAFLECESGRALLSFYATVEIAVPFPADTSEDGKALVGGLYTELQDKELAELGKAVGGDSAALALKILPLLMPHLLENMRKRVPTLLDYTGALGGAVGHGVDALPMYHLLGARLIAEASLRQAADPERFPAASDEDKEAERARAREEAQAEAQAQVEAAQAEAQAQAEARIQAAQAEAQAAQAQAQAQAQAEIEAARAEAAAIKAEAQAALARAQAAEHQAQVEAAARRAAEQEAESAAAAAAAAAATAALAAETARRRAEQDAAQEIQRLQAQAEAQASAAQAEAAAAQARAEAAEQARLEAERAADRAAIERQVAHQRTFLPPPPEPEPPAQSFPEPIAPTPVPQPPEPIVEPSLEAPEPPEARPVPEPTTPAATEPAEPPKKGGMGKWIVLGLGALLLFGCCGAIGLGGLAAYMDQASSSAPKTPKKVYVGPDGKPIDPSQVPSKKK
jgi:hypothetical protein